MVRGLFQRLAAARGDQRFARVEMARRLVQHQAAVDCAPRPAGSVPSRSMTAATVTDGLPDTHAAFLGVLPDEVGHALPRPASIASLEAA